MIGIVLAGGQSRRMGQDKALLRHASGQTWLAHSVELLEALCSEVWVSGRAGERGIMDEQPLAGPAAAIAHCARVLPDDVLLIIPVDLPWLTTSALLELMHHDADAVHFQGHPLPLLLRINAKKRIQNVDAPQNMSVKQLLAGLNVAALELPAQHQKALTNVNRPTDY
ncbi:MAG: molybdenum cofactor guanylyltransferase [Formosimonas sp.]